MTFPTEDTERIDWQLLRHGAVTLFWRNELYLEAIQSLEKLNYNLLEFSYENKLQFCEDVSRQLKWKQQFGYTPWTGNLDALDDGLRGEPYDSGEHAVFCIRQFHKCMKDDSEWASVVLDVLECQSRDYLLDGKRLIVLIQTDDPNFECAKLGGRRPNWNSAEWMNSSRGV